MARADSNNVSKPLHIPVAVLMNSVVNAKRSSMDHIVFTLQIHHTCLYLVSVHQAAPPLTTNSSHVIAAYYSFIDPKG